MSSANVLAVTSSLVLMAMIKRVLNRLVNSAA